MKKFLFLCSIFLYSQAQDPFKEIEDVQREEYKALLRGLRDEIEFHKDINNKLSKVDLAQEGNKTIVPILTVNKTRNLYKFIPFGKEAPDMMRFIRSHLSEDIESLIELFNERFSYNHAYLFPYDPGLNALFIVNTQLAKKSARNALSQIEKIYDKSENENIKKAASILLFMRLGEGSSYVKKAISDGLEALENAPSFVEKELKLNQFKSYLRRFKDTPQDLFNPNKLNKVITFFNQLDLAPITKPVKEKIKPKPKAKKQPKKPTKKEKGKEKKERVALPIEPRKEISLRYDQRIEKWFDPSIFAQKLPHSIIYHRFPKVIDRYLVDMGAHKKFRNRTKPKQMDDSYSLFGETIFDDGTQEHVQYHLTMDPKKIIYHRGIEPRTFDQIVEAFGEGPESKAWEILQREDNFPALGEIKPKLSSFPDGVVEDNDLIVKVRDNALGANFVIYKPSM